MQIHCSKYLQLLMVVGNCVLWSNALLICALDWEVEGSNLVLSVFISAFSFQIEHLIARGVFTQALACECLVTSSRLKLQVGQSRRRIF